MTLHIPFDNSYARLPDGFFARQGPTPVKAPSTVAFNSDLAALLGITGADDPALAAILGGNAIPEGQSLWPNSTQATSSASSTRSLAMAAPCCWVRSLAPTASAATSSSKALARPRFPAAAMAAHGWARCCANMWCQRRCTPLASPPPAHWPRSAPDRTSSANAPCPAPF